MNKKPIILQNIDFNKIQFSKIKKNNKKKVIYLNYDNDNFVIQTPSLNCIKKPFKLSECLWDLELPLEGEKEKKINEFIIFLKKLDQFIIKLAKENSKEWFYDVDNATYLNSIRESALDKYKNGFIKLKIVNSDNFKTLIKKDNKYKISVKDINEDYKLKSILQIYAVWIKPNNQFGIYFRPLVISISKRSIKPLNYDFIKESEEDNLLSSSENSNSIFLKKKEINENLIMDTTTFDANSSESSETSSDKSEININDLNKTRDEINNSDKILNL